MIENLKLSLYISLNIPFLTRQLCCVVLCQCSVVTPLLQQNYLYTAVLGGDADFSGALQIQKEASYRCRPVI